MKKRDLEAEFAFQVKVLGLPEPKRNYRKVIPGRNYEFDFVWDQYHVALEVQGATWVPGKGHSSGTGILRDTTKLCMATVNGWKVLQLVDKHIDSGDGINWTEALLKQAGWKREL